jgi:tetrahydromethanopterin:alpha-L-glutamate ligase
LAETGPKVGVVGVAGGWSSEALADAFASKTGFRLLVDMRRVVFDAARGSVTFGGVDLCGVDGLVIKKIGERYSPDMLDRLELLRYVADSGVPVFSKPSSILRLLDRLSCTLTLRNANVPMPPTVITEDVDEAVAAVAGFGTAVLKPLYSTKARGMQLVSTTAGSDLRSDVAAFKAAGNTVLYVQQKIAIPDRDLGIVFLGGRYRGSYARVRGAGSSWNTTIHEGGHYEPHDASPEVIEVARRAQAAFDLDFTSVDVAETDSGPVVFEVSAFGGFRGLREGLEVDAASEYADYVLGKLAHG